MRLYLAPLTVWTARALGASRVVLDADDDDSAVLRALGEPAEAAAYERLARCWLPGCDEVFAASLLDAVGLSSRASAGNVGVIPNAVHLPHDMTQPPGTDRLLFVGNLTYAPNRLAAELLARQVLPLVRSRRAGTTLSLVGRHDDTLGPLADLDGVEVTGEVPDVRPHYEKADVVVAPLRHGAGTRIKILEAFAHERPVVATPVAAAGLTIGDEGIVRASSPTDLAVAVAHLLAEPARAASMVEHARRWVAARHSTEVVAPLVRDALLGRVRPDSTPSAGGGE
jgi:glycosyltransferase involved in cell wall biosynthesis